MKQIVNIKDVHSDIQVWKVKFSKIFKKNIMTKERINKAIQAFGENIVNEVMLLVDICDPDGCHAMFETMGMFEYVECVEMLYFD